MNKNKRGQSEIITTVLIILLVLAAIVIVWQVVKSTVEGGSKQVTAQSGCIGMDLKITNVGSLATSITNVTVSRGADSIPDANLNSIKVIVEDSTGTQKCNLDISTGLPKTLEEKLLITTCTGLTTATVYNVKIAPKISNQQCNVASTIQETTP